MPLYGGVAYGQQQAAPTAPRRLLPLYSYKLAFRSANRAPVLTGGGALLKCLLV